MFSAALDRDELIGRRLRSLAETLCDGSLTPLLTHLARAKDLTDEDRLALRAIIDEAEDEPPSPGEVEGDRPRRRSGRPAGAAGRRVDGDQENRAEVSFMESLVHGMLSNAVAAAVLAVLVAGAGPHLPPAGPDP